MGLVLIAWCSTLWFISISAADPANPDVSTLRFIHVVWRHGDRSPSDPTFPTDTENPEWSWPQGWGELTETGMSQHYALGTILRQRYVDTGFLLDHYNASQMYVRSSDYNRTIMSALSNLAGMYPPSEQEQFMKDMNWRPIPVHVVPKDNDPVIWMDRPCPKAQDIYFNEILKSDDARKVEDENADLITFLRDKTGQPLSTLDEVRLVYDPLNCERIHNDSHTWPDWMNMSLFTSIEELYRVSKTFCFHDPRMQRFRGSLLFWDIAQRSQQKALNDPSLKPATLKYYAYSAHDTTLMALLENLGAYDGRVPLYATAVIFELHERTGKYFIQVWYLNETGGQIPVPVPVKECESIGECSLEKFVDVARGQTPTDWYGECGIHDREDNEKYKRVKVAAEVLGASTAILLILLIITIAQLLRRSGNSRMIA